jgi:hypothetical protein
VPRGSGRRRTVSFWATPFSNMTTTENVADSPVVFRHPEAQIRSLTWILEDPPRRKGRQPGHLRDVDARIGETAVAIALPATIFHSMREKADRYCPWDPNRRHAHVRGPSKAPPGSPGCLGVVARGGGVRPPADPDGQSCRARASGVADMTYAQLAIGDAVPSARGPGRGAERSGKLSVDASK